MELSDKQRRRAIEGFIIHGFKIGYGSGRRLESTTISAILHGIKHFFTAHGVDFPCGHPQLRMLIKGVSQFDAPRQHKAPVSIAIMEAIFGSLCLARSSDQALWGVLCISLFFLLRRSEIVAIQGSDFKWFALKAEDLVVVDRLGVPTSCPASADAVYLKLRGSKTNQAGPATVRMLNRSGHPVLCPVVGALLLHQARLSIPTSLPAAVYSVYNKGQYCIATSHVSSAIQCAAIQLGEDPKRFSSHSLRSDGATLMYRAGVDGMTIQSHGRWSSDCFKMYASLCEESVSVLASKIVGGTKRDSTLR